MGRKEPAVLILIGFVIGILVGTMCQRWGWTGVVDAGSLLGDLFLRGLRMVVIPLIFSSLALGIAHLGDVTRLSRLGALTVLYYIATNFIAVTIGLVLVNLLQPGVGVTLPLGEKPQTPSLTLTDLVRSAIPANPFESLAKGETLPLIFLALLTGILLLVAQKEGEPVRRLLDSVLKLTMIVVRWLIAIAPLGVFGLAVSLTAKFGLDAFKPIAKYAVVVLLGLAAHGVFALPLLAWTFGRTSPLSYLRRFAPALLTALSTSSSSATLPVTLGCAHQAGIRDEVRNFVLPLGATVNMDGTALYEAVAACFVAQVLGMNLSLSQQLIVFITANLAAIGAAGIPSAGLVTMGFVFQSVGLPLEGIAFILPIDRFLDMFRTTVNVEGDIIGCAVVQKRLQ